MIEPVDVICTLAHAWSPRQYPPPGSPWVLPTSGATVKERFILGKTIHLVVWDNALIARLES